MRIALPAKLGTLGAFSRPAGLVFIAALGLGGCTQVQQGLDMIQPPPVNPSSPIAAYAEQVSRETFPTPTFNNIPPKPTDVRAPDAYKTVVMGQIAMRRELGAWRATHPELTSDTEAWADLQRRRIPRSAAVPVSPTQDAESAAFAKRLREEADKPHPQN